MTSMLIITYRLIKTTIWVNIFHRSCSRKIMGYRDVSK